MEHGFSEATLSLFEKMQRLVCCLKACGSIRATLAGNEIHKDIVQKAVERCYFLGNTLVDMYEKIPTMRYIYTSHVQGCTCVRRI